MGGIEGVLSLFAGNLGVTWSQIDKREVIIGTPADEAKAPGDQGRSQGFRVGHHLLRVSCKLRFQAFTEADGFTRNHMLKRPALGTRENTVVDRLGVLGCTKNKTAAGTA